MNDELQIFIDKSDGTTVLESLVRSMTISKDPQVISDLKELVLLEIRLARIEAEKALGEARKATITPLKGV